jgi:hypothetical protein
VIDPDIALGQVVEDRSYAAVLVFKIAKKRRYGR